MTCANCGATAAEGQRFCGQCGSALVAVCGSCGIENPPDNRFCGACGGSLADAPASPPISSGPALAERRVVSVLFVDLVGFTSFSERRDPEEVRALITEYFDLAKEAIEWFGGTVDKYIGDAVMAWWGATTSQEDDAERAVRAALEVVDRVAQLGERHGLPALAARAGVMTGEASVGPGGNEKGLLLGDMVNATSRLQSLAEPGSVFVGEVTAGLVDRAIALEDAGTHAVKGKDEPIVARRAVRVIGERGGVGRADVLEPPFVGRDPELRLLKDALHTAGRDGRARLVSLVGQGGIGKSRLVWEFLKYIDGLVDDVYWHEGRSPSYGDGVSLWALGEMVRQRAGISETDDDTTTAARLAETIERWVDDADQRAWIAMRLGALLGVGDAVGSERTEIFAAARALFEAISAHGTTVLVFEDLQWADPGLLEFIEELPDWSQNHPILVVTATRPDLLDRRPDWGSGRRGFTSVYLAPLGDQEMGDLISGAVPGIPTSAVGRITAAAGGVPLFAVEMLRTLLADGRLAMVDGTAAVTGDLTEIEVPSSVQAVIAARLDRLPAEERELARDASVLGQSFTVDGLTALRDDDADKVERRLGDLVRHEILELNRDPRSPERGQYRWVQSLLKEVAYGRIGRSDRHDLHLRAARYFRGLDDPELAPVAASHYVSAVEVAPPSDALAAELVTALEAAIARAKAIHAHEQLIDLVDVALPVVSPAMSIDLREAAALAAVALGDPDVADRHVDALLAMDADAETRHRVVALAGWVANNSYRSERAVALLSEHLADHPDIASDENLTRAAVYLTRARMLATGGGDEDNIRMADDAIGAAEALGLVEEVADAMITRGTLLVDAGRPHQGMALIRGAVALAREHDFTDTRLRGLVNTSYASRDFAERWAAVEEAFGEAKRVGNRAMATFVAGNMLGALFGGLDLDASEALLDDPVLVANSPADQLRHALTRAWIARFRGDWPAWERHMATAEELGREVTDPQATIGLRGEPVARAAMEGDYRQWLEHARWKWHDYGFNPTEAAIEAVRAACLLGDPAAIAEARTMLAAVPDGTETTVLTAHLAAVEAALDGDDSAARLADEAIRLGLDVPGVPWREQAFITGLTVARHLHPGPDRDHIAEQTRTIATDAGALGLVEFLDRILAAD